MRNTILASIMLIFSLTGNAQDTIVLYLDANFYQTEKANTKNIREAIINDNHYQVTDKNTNGAILNYCEYKSLNPRIEEGFAQHYHGPDTLYSSGNYCNGKIQGQWMYYNNDNTIDTVYYLPLEDYFSKRNCPKSEYYDKNSESKNIGDIIIDSLSSFISENFHMPGRLVNEINNYVYYISCTFDIDGKIKCPEIVNSIDEDINNEIFRILHKFKYEIELSIPINFSVTLPYRKLGDSKDDVYIIVEDMPKFKGGDQNKFREYIMQKLRYPESAAEKGISGIVFVQFAVNPEGDVVNVKVVRSVEPSLDAEALRVVKSSPKWEPGKQDGKPISVQFTFPIVFICEK